MQWGTSGDNKGCPTRSGADIADLRVQDVHCEPPTKPTVARPTAQVKGKLTKSRSEEGSGRGRNLFLAASDAMSSGTFRLPSEDSLQVDS